MEATSGRRIKPEAGGAIRGTAPGASGRLVGKNFRDEVRSVPPEIFPGVLARAVEIATKGRPRDHQAASAAVVARVEDRKWPGRRAHSGP